MAVSRGARSVRWRSGVVSGRGRGAIGEVLTWKRLDGEVGEELEGRTLVLESVPFGEVIFEKCQGGLR